ncbi:hypothetical protein BP00DRAFT_355454, partial [Aspergillus indologenus CBS 114.80]
FYHSDRPLTQQALARTLSYNLVPTLPRTTVHKFLRAFWLTIGRDFHSIDRLRLDKYLFLIRCYVGVGFEVFLKGNKGIVPNGAGAGDAAEGKKRKREEENSNTKKGGKKRKGKGQQQQQQQQQQPEEEQQQQDTKTEEVDLQALEAYLAILEEGPLCPLNFDPDQPPANEAEDFVPMPHGPDGLRYHVMDIWVDELEKVLEFEEVTTAEGTTAKKPKGPVPAELLLRPLERLRKESPYKPVRVRAAEALDDERLVEWGWKERKVESDSEDEDEDEEDEDEDEEWGGFGDE